MPPRVVAAEEQWATLEGAIQAWMQARDWPVGSRLAFWRQTRSMRRDLRLRTLTTTLVGLSRGEVEPTVPTPGLDISLELQAALDGTESEGFGSDDVPPGTLDLRLDSILASRVATAEAACYYEAGEVPEDAAVDEALEETLGEEALEEAAEAETTAVEEEAVEEAPESEVFEEVVESEAAPVPHEGDVEEAAEPTAERPTDGLIRFVIQPKRRPQQAPWPKVFGRHAWIDLPRP